MNTSEHASVPGISSILQLDGDSYLTLTQTGLNGRTETKKYCQSGKSLFLDRVSGMTVLMVFSWSVDSDCNISTAFPCGSPGNVHVSLWMSYNEL